MQLSDYAREALYEYSVRAMEWSDMTQEAPRKVLTTAYPRSRQRFVGAESDVNVVSAVTCCIFVRILHFLGTPTVKQYPNHKSQSSNYDFL